MGKEKRIEIIGGRRMVFLEETGSSEPPAFLRGSLYFAYKERVGKLKEGIKIEETRTAFRPSPSLVDISGTLKVDEDMVFYWRCLRGLLNQRFLSTKDKQEGKMEATRWFFAPLCLEPPLDCSSDQREVLYQKAEEFLKRNRVELNSAIFETCEDWRPACRQGRET